MHEDEANGIDDLQFLEEVMNINETLVDISENDPTLGVLKEKTEGIRTMLHN